MNLKAKLQNPNPAMEASDVEIIGFVDMLGTLHGIFIRESGDIGAAPSYTLKVVDRSKTYSRILADALKPGVFTDAIRADRKVDIRSTEPNQKIKPRLDPYETAWEALGLRPNQVLGHEPTVSKVAEAIKMGREEIEKLRDGERVPTQTEARRDSKRQYLYGRYTAPDVYAWEPSEPAMDTERGEAKKLAEAANPDFAKVAHDAIHSLGGLYMLAPDEAGHYTRPMLDRINDRVIKALGEERQRAVNIARSCMSETNLDAASALCGTIAARIAGATPKAPLKDILP